MSLAGFFIGIKMNKDITKNKYLHTFDIGLSAVIISKGYPLISVDKSNPKKVQFVFQKSNKLNSIVENYWSKTLEIEPQTLLSNLKMLKNRIYSNEL